jgi:flagellar biosynthesis chaperone FliJ
MSAKRRFRLDSVLRVARLREKQAEKSLAERVRDEQRAAAEVLERTAVFEASGTPEPAPATEFSADRLARELRAGAVLSAAEARGRAAEQLVAARDEWLRAARHRRTVEELEERHHAAHAMVAAQAAQRTLDDLARVRQGRRR